MEIWRASPELLRLCFFSESTHTQWMKYFQLHRSKLTLEEQEKLWGLHCSDSSLILHALFDPALCYSFSGWMRPPQTLQNKVLKCSLQSTSNTISTCLLSVLHKIRYLHCFLQRYLQHRNQNLGTIPLLQSYRPNSPLPSQLTTNDLY